jgi:hypothetical protein
LLDIGGGHGLYSIFFTRKYPELQRFWRFRRGWRRIIGWRNTARRAVNKIGKTKVMLLITVFDCTYGRSDGGKENALTILTSSAILTASGFITRQTAG